MEFMTLEDYVAEAEKDKVQKELPTVRTLMPMKDFYKAQNFISNVGEFINLPYKTLDCGCIYVELMHEDESLLWVYISTCPICKLKETIEDHRSHYDFGY